MQHRSLLGLTVLLLGTLAVTLAFLPPRFARIADRATVPGMAAQATSSGLPPQPASPESISWIGSAPEITVEQLTANPAAYKDKDVILAATMSYGLYESYLSDDAGQRKVAIAGFPEAARAESDALAYFKSRNDGRAPVYAYGRVLTGGAYSTGATTTPYAVVLKDLRLR